MKSLQRAAVAIALGLTAAACSDSGGSSTPMLRVDLIDDAVTALQSKLGGEQRYFEVNATPTLVNLFVADSQGTQATAYVFLAGKLEDPAAPIQASGPTFAGSQIAFDEAQVLGPVRDELPEATLRVFSIVGQPAGEPRFVVSVQSALGGQLEVPVRADGSIIAAGG